MSATAVVEPPGTTWSGTYHYRAAALHRPTSVEALQQLVATRPALHALGTRHSFNDVADAAELVSVAGLPGEPVLDEAARTVSVPAAMRYGELAPWLDERGWALGALASLPHISVAGSVATGTHGSGNDNPSLAAAVRGLTLVDGRGELVRLGAEHPDLPGAVVAVGALGVVTEVVLTVEPRFQMRQDIYLGLPWERLTADVDAVLGAGYSVSAVVDFADPQVHAIWVKSRLADGDPGTMPDTLFGARAATEKVHLTPGNDPGPCTPQLGEPGPWYERLPHFLLHFTPSSGAEIQSEYLMAREHAGAAITALRGIGAGFSPVLRSAEIRTVAADELWLSSGYRRDVVGIHFTWYPEPGPVTAAVADIERALAPFAPRPHWGKVFGEGHDWAGLYPQLPGFRALAERYDPRGVFRNPFLARTLLS